jgi:hypothetical protein
MRNVAIQCDLSFRSPSHPQEFHEMNPGWEHRSDGVIVAFSRCTITGEKYGVRENPVRPDGRHSHWLGGRYSLHPATRKHRPDLLLYPWEKKP